MDWLRLCIQTKFKLEFLVLKTRFVGRDNASHEVGQIWHVVDDLKTSESWQKTCERSASLSKGRGGVTVLCEIAANLHSSNLQVLVCGNLHL
jgi:hypothetical protein